MLAKEVGVTGEANAWSDPASGCYALEQRVSAATVGTSDLDAIADHLRRELARSSTVERWEVSRARSDSLAVSFALERASLRAVGRVVGEPEAADGLHLRVVTCFYNQRDPRRCARLCGELVGEEKR